MKNNTINKISIWLLSFTLVVVFVFGRFEFTRNELVTYKLNTDVVEEVDASLLLTAVGLVALSVFLSLGASHTADLIRTNASAFTSWYTNWYSDTSFADQNEWQTAHKAETYLVETGQLNSDGSLKNADSVVLPKEILSNFYKSAEWYMNDYIDAGGIKWFALNYNNTNTIYVPTVKDVETIRFDQTNISVINGTKSLSLLNTALYKTTINEVQISPSVYRLKITIRDLDDNVIEEKYSANLTYEQSVIYAQNDGFIISILNAHSTYRYFGITPLFWNADYTYSQGLYLEFKLATTTSTVSVPINNYNTNMVMPTNNYKGMSDSNIVINENGFPTSVDDSSNYFVVDTTQPTPPVTNLPEDQEHLYTYIPQTNPTYPDILDGMPITNPIEQTNDPTLTVPLPGVDDLLDGTYFKDIIVWFTAWWVLTISNITNFWNTAWANLTLGINWLGQSIEELIIWLGNTITLPITQATINFDLFKETLGSDTDIIIDILQFFFDVVEFAIKFVVHTISFLFDLVSLLVGAIFNLLRSTISTFITLIQSLYSFFPAPIRNVANFVFTTLGFALVYKFIRSVLGLKGV